MLCYLVCVLNLQISTLFEVLSWIMQFWCTETLASVVLSIIIQKKCFSPLNTSFSGRRHFGSLFINEEQKRFGPLRIWYFASHDSHVDDVTDTDCGAQKAGIHGRVSVTFKRWFWGKRARNRVKNCCVSIVYSNPVNGTPDASSVCSPLHIARKVYVSIITSLHHACRLLSCTGQNILRP